MNNDYEAVVKDTYKANVDDELNPVKIHSLKDQNGETHNYVLLEDHVRLLSDISAIANAPFGKIFGTKH